MRLFSSLFLVWLFCFGIQGKVTADNWKRAYLVTFPRSGNHWMRYLIEEATQIATGSVYQDMDRPVHLEKIFPWGGYSTDHGYKGNCRYPKPQDIVIIKTHFPFYTLGKVDAPEYPSALKVRIVRHPVDSVSSLLLLQHGSMPSPIPRQELKELVDKWREFQEYWDTQKNVVTIRYEDLLDAPYETLEKVLKVLGLKAQKNDIERAIRKNPPRGGVLKHASRFRPRDLKFIQNELKDIMDEYGYTINKE